MGCGDWHVDKIVKGDELAFRFFVDTYSKDLYYFVLGYVHTREVAEGLLVISKGDGTIERRQDAPKVWEFNGSIYVINSTRLKEVGLSKLNRIRKYVMDDLHSIDIDSMFDWYMAEKVISSHLIEN